MSVGTYALVQLDEVKAILDLDDAQNARDSLLERMVDDVTSLLEVFCDRQFKARDYTNEDHDGTGTHTLYTNQYPINSITSLYDDTYRVFEADTLIASADYVFYSSEGRVELTAVTGSLTSIGFVRYQKNVRINYNAGYTTIPPILRMIACEIIMKKYKAYSDRTIGDSAVSHGGANITLTLSDILPDHRDILNREFRRIDFMQGGD